MQARLISFANSTLKIEYAGRHSSHIIDILYRYVPANHRDTPHLTYRLLSLDEPKGIQLYRQDVSLCGAGSPGTVAELLLGDSCYHLAMHSRDGLLFHAAALAWQGRGLLLPGASGAGKSTLTAWLLTRGFDYLTDELVFVEWDANTLQTLTRPLNLKHASRSVLSEQFDFEAQTSAMLSSSASDLIPHTLFNPTNTLSQPPLKLIIFPCYQPQTNFELIPLSKAQAGLALLQTLINARNLPEQGFSETTRLARQAPAYRMAYNSFDQIETKLKDLLYGS